MLWFPMIVGLAAARPISLPTNMVDRDRIIMVARLYLMAVAIPAACLSLTTMLYAPVGLVRNRGGRIVHLGQLIIAISLLATVVWIVLIVFFLMLNPG